MTEQDKQKRLNLELPTEPTGFYEVMDPSRVELSRGAPMSASTLFHYTRSLESLEGILYEGFKPSYSQEDFGWAFAAGRQGDSFCIPMVCFCDIPLSRAAAHREGYGAYAVGLGKTWGLSTRVSPVAYVVEGTPLATHFRSLMANASSAPTADRVRSLLGLTKPYQGDHPRTGTPMRFYDEREWRYIPPSAIWPRPHELQGRTDAGEELKPLMFAAHDVRYIVVAEEKEVLPMFEVIGAICEGRSVTAEAAVLLKSRVTSAERIRADY